MAYNEPYDSEKQAYISQDRKDSLSPHNGKLVDEDGAVPGETFSESTPSLMLSAQWQTCKSL